MTPRVTRPPVTRLAHPTPASFTLHTHCHFLNFATDSRPPTLKNREIREMETDKEDEIKNEQSTSTTHEQIEEIKSEFNLQMVCTINKFWWLCYDS